MAIARLLASFRSNILSTNFHRSISLSAARNLKEIRETKEGNTIIVEGVDLPHPKEHLMLKTSENGACPLCSAGVNVKHTDVLILKQFVNSQGHMLPRRITGLCYIQQKRVGIMVTMAQKAGLMPNLAPPNSKKDPKKRYKWKAFNTYYDETTIKQKYY
ncbi:39S ribosomal protein S18a, mitochondrial [Nasonia vitripennis]|uniref:28S ribosomal protein S18a, mitochondrial n=1 Tax=Nasonia vitripennis TaxID=7425 RepID=A0A7M7G5B5_NASVI|nr:39S ribosomal protein S18a, mitochondrial [Nasonia vitripennis]